MITVVNRYKYIYMTFKKMNQMNQMNQINQINQNNQKNKFYIREIIIVKLVRKLILMIFH